MSALKTHKLPADDCPSCGERCAVASTGMTDHRPEPGDFSICINCQGLHVFDCNIRLRHPTEAEIGKLPLVFLQRYQAAITATKICKGARL